MEARLWLIAVYLVGIGMIANPVVQVIDILQKRQLMARIEAVQDCIDSRENSD